MARILIVDDALFMRKAVSDALIDGGHEIVGEATNGEEALERYRQLQPDLVTLDITMPELDGMWALAAIRMSDPSARIIMCSALGQEAKVLESIRGGAKDFVVKPIQPERLLGAIANALAA
jgi:two-component system chemotaxis response regulator CheY